MHAHYVLCPQVLHLKIILHIQFHTPAHDSLMQNTTVLHLDLNPIRSHRPCLETRLYKIKTEYVFKVTAAAVLKL